MELVITIKGVIDILGIEEENIKNYNTRQLKKEFNYLLNKHPNCEICLQADYGIYFHGKIVESTEYLFAIKR